MAKIPLVAIVDDDEEISEALCELLMSTGLTCRCFGSASAFLATYPASGFDALVTDIRMPGMSGIDLLDRLRTIDPAFPTIVLTSVSNERDRNRAFELGIMAWLMKPVTDDVLLGHLQSALAGGDYLWPEEYWDER